MVKHGMLTPLGKAKIHIQVVHDLLQDPEYEVTVFPRITRNPTYDKLPTQMSFAALGGQVDYGHYCV